MAPKLFVLMLTVVVSFVALVQGDPDPLQDFCVEDPNSSFFVNGAPCKDPTKVTADDFTSTILREPANTNNTLGIDVDLVDITMFPGLNTQGVSVARLSFGKSGVNPPHNHPRASEVIYLMEGRLYVGFVSTSNKLFTKVLYPGDLFIFPRGLVHFQWSLDNKPALAVAVLGSQNPGRTDIAKALFNSMPEVADQVLTRTLQVGTDVVNKLRNGVSRT